MRLSFWDVFSPPIKARLVASIFFLRIFRNIETNRFDPSPVTLCLFSVAIFVCGNDAGTAVVYQFGGERYLVQFVFRTKEGGNAFLGAGLEIRLFVARKNRNPAIFFAICVLRWPEKPTSRLGFSGASVCTSVCPQNNVERLYIRLFGMWSSLGQYRSKSFGLSFLIHPTPKILPPQISVKI